MRVLVAGATGVIGQQLTPLLAAAGHEVFALARDGGRSDLIASLGARRVVGDLLHGGDVRQAARTVRPQAVIHLATAIPPDLNPRRLAEQFELTNRLRTEGTRNLLDAAAEVGADRILTQSIAFAYEPGDSGPADEDTALWRVPPKPFKPLLAALQDLERQTRDAGGLVLRFGHLYGPESSFAADGAFTAKVRKGKVPLVGGGTSVFSFTHAHDAATSLVAALDKPSVGALNVVDDDPAPMHEWLPVMAEALGAPRPKPAPAAIAKLAVGSWGVAYMTQLRGASNARAKLQLDWKPRYGSWREGFATELLGPATSGV